MIPYPTLKQGSSGPEVGSWQRFLTLAGLLPKLSDDESFGAKTHAATVEWQTEQKLTPDGVVGPKTLQAAMPLGLILFVQARYYAKRFPNRGRDVRQIVIHTIECAESNLNAAEDNALWFAGKSPYPPNIASAHYLVDADSVIQSVREGDIAYHANQANEHGMGIEHAGFAAQTDSEWADAFSAAILQRSAQLTARIAFDYEVPIRRLTPADLLTDERGFCGHVDVNAAYSNEGGHVDPGPHFPWDKYLGMVAGELAKLAR